MARKVILFITQTLDGYIANSDGKIDSYGMINFQQVVL